MRVQRLNVHTRAKPVWTYQDAFGNRYKQRLLKQSPFYIAFKAYDRKVDAVNFNEDKAFTVIESAQTNKRTLIYKRRKTK